MPRRFRRRGRRVSKFRRSVPFKRYWSGNRRISLYSGIARDYLLTSLRQVSSVTSDASGNINKIFPLRDPSAQEDWGSFTAVYDQYKIVGFKMQFIPYAPNDVSSTIAWRALYVYYDQDSTTGISTVATAIQYTNVKAFNIYRPWKRYTKVGSISASSTGGVILSGGFVDIASPVTNGIAGLYGSGFSNSTTYGNLVTTYYVVFKNRR